MSDSEASAQRTSLAAAAIAASALAEHGHQTGICANCAAPTIAAYCAVCGQERDTHRRSVWGLVRDLVEDIVSFDSRILRTAIALLVEPGEIPKAFREGRTQRYVPALRLYFFVSLVFFLLLSMTGLAIIQLELVPTPMKVFRDANGGLFFRNPAYDANDDDLKNMPPLIPLKKDEVEANGMHYGLTTETYFFAPIGAHHVALPPSALAHLRSESLGFSIQAKPLNAADAKQQAAAKHVAGWLDKNIFGGLQRIAVDPAALNGPMTVWIPRMLFLLLPLYALLLFAHYWRDHRKFYFVDHLIFSLSVHTFLFVVLIVDVGLAQFLSGGTVAWLTVAALGIYIFIAMKRFYEQGWFWTTVKFASVSFIYTIFFLLPAIGGALVLSFLGD